MTPFARAYLGANSLLCSLSQDLLIDKEVVIDEETLTTIHGYILLTSRTKEGKFARYNLWRDTLEYAGFEIFESDEAAYQHWLKEMSALDQCLDVSGEGKYHRDITSMHTRFFSSPIVGQSAQTGQFMSVGSDSRVRPVSVGYDKGTSDETARLAAEVTKDRVKVLKKSRETFCRQGRG